LPVATGAAARPAYPARSTGRLSRHNKVTCTCSGGGRSAFVGTKLDRILPFSQGGFYGRAGRESYSSWHGQATCTTHADLLGRFRHLWGRRIDRLHNPQHVRDRAPPQSHRLVRTPRRVHAANQARICETKLPSRMALSKAHRCAVRLGRHYWAPRRKRQPLDIVPAKVEKLLVRCERSRARRSIVMDMPSMA